MNAIITWHFRHCRGSAGAPFIFFSAMMALQFFVVLFAFPETKGITLEDMQRKFGIA